MYVCQIVLVAKFDLTARVYYVHGGRGVCMCVCNIYFFTYSEKIFCFINVIFLKWGTPKTGLVVLHNT